jgi:hypothetical protein
MTYFEQLLALPTIVVTRTYYHPHSVKAGLLGKLKETDGKTAKVIVYGPDLGYPVRGEGLNDEADYLTLDLDANAFRQMPTLSLMDQFIVRAMLSYPSIFPTRESVLTHAFLVLGNGYDWNKKGWLDDGCRDSLSRVRMSYEDTTMEGWSMRDMGERRAARIAERDPNQSYDEILKKDFERHVERANADNLVRQKRELYIDFHATERSKYNLRGGYYENAVNLANMIEQGFLPASKIPACADRSFLEGMVEILTKAVLSTKGYYKYRASLDEPTENMPAWLTRRADAAAADAVEDKSKDEEYIKTNIVPACRYLENLISDIKVRIRNTVWDFVKVAQRALTAMGFGKKATMDASNGSGWAGHYAPKTLTDENLALLARRLKGKGFIKDGLTWTRADWFVTVRLVPVGDRYRAEILIITHPEDRQGLLDTMHRAFNDGWLNHLRHDAMSVIRASETVATREEALKMLDAMSELEIEALLADTPKEK